MQTFMKATLPRDNLPQYQASGILPNFLTVSANMLSLKTQSRTTYGEGGYRYIKKYQRQKHRKGYLET